MPPHGPGGRLVAWACSAGESFRIVVRTRVRERGSRRARLLQRSELIEALAHEWAHCMAWNSDTALLEAHGPNWGVAYATCYRTVIED